MINLSVPTTGALVQACVLSCGGNRLLPPPHFRWTLQAILPKLIPSDLCYLTCYSTTPSPSASKLLAWEMQTWPQFCTLPCALPLCTSPHSDFGLSHVTY